MCLLTNYLPSNDGIDCVDYSVRHVLINYLVIYYIGIFNCEDFQLNVHVWEAAIVSGAGLPKTRQLWAVLPDAERKTASWWR